MASDIEELTRVIQNYRFDLKKQTTALEALIREIRRSNNLTEEFHERLDQIMENPNA